MSSIGSSIQSHDQDRHSQVFIHLKTSAMTIRINPFGLPTERFLVAENNEGQLVGFGQLQQQPSASDVQFLELRTLIVREESR